MKKERKIHLIKLIGCWIIDISILLATLLSPNINNELYKVLIVGSVILINLTIIMSVLWILKID